MIQQVNVSPIAFERVVIESMSEPLLEYEFRAEPIAPYYQNVSVSFVRVRLGQKESISVGRICYREDRITEDTNDEVDSPRHDDLFGTYYPSRHFFAIDVITNSLISEILRDGRIGMARTDEEKRWYFKDEEDLRRVLREELLPILLKDGLQVLNDNLEDIAERARRKERTAA
jgi:hypothetical protein